MREDPRCQHQHRVLEGSTFSTDGAAYWTPRHHSTFSDECHALDVNVDFGSREVHADQCNFQVAATDAAAINISPDHRICATLRDAYGIRGAAIC